ncbi:MAG TPA: PaaI family thioesterase [Anaeromyxobacteraceae bacterium]|nr:PaaI family thioesterase [Anaeromyxobacteraceae bacterium]
MPDFFGFQSPFLDTCGIRAVSREPGRVVGEVTLGPGHLNSFGLGHGGVAMTLLDTVLGAAARFADPATATVMTVDLHVTFIGPARGRIVAEGRVLHQAGGLVFCEGEARTEDGELVAKAVGTFKARSGS